MPNPPPSLPPLVDRLVPAAEVAAAEAAAAGWPRLALDATALADLALLGMGAYSPLEGFLGQADLAAVCAGQRLHDGTPWPWPVTLAAEPAAAQVALAAGHALLVGPDDAACGEIAVTEAWARDRAVEARALLGPDAPEEAVAAAAASRAPWYVAGPVRWYGRAPRPFPAHQRGPAEARAALAARGHAAVVGAWPPALVDRGTEHLAKAALALTDAFLWLLPVGPGDERPRVVPDAARLRSLERVIALAFPAGRASLVVCPTGGRAVGPRAAVLHALVLRNYGCTHVLVDARQGAEAQAAVVAVAGELGFVAWLPEEAFHCRECGQAATARTCPHPAASHVAPGPEGLAALLRAGHAPPTEVMRPEVAAVLLPAMREPGTAVAAVPAADGGGAIAGPVAGTASIEGPEAAGAGRPAGRTIWLTGLAGAGKSTVAALLAAAMRARGRRVDLLDGDAVHLGLTADLGTGRADRIEHDRRLGHLASLLNRNGVDAVVAAVSPLAAGRDAARALVSDFTEVFVSCPIEICARRDGKGVYRQAFAGELPDLPGVGAPYEPPAQPDLELRTDLEELEVCVDRLLALIGV